MSYVWDLAHPGFADRFAFWRPLLSDWQIVWRHHRDVGFADRRRRLGCRIVLRVERRQPARAPRAFPRRSGCAAAERDVPAGFFFNPSAFTRPTVQLVSQYPSSGGTATAGELGTDIGNVGRNCLRGPRQTNVDLAIAKHFRIGQSRNLELRAEFFNLFNQVNFANPISDLSAVESTGGAINRTSGAIVESGDFGRVISTSNNPRLVQLALKISF